MRDDFGAVMVMVVMVAVVVVAVVVRCVCVCVGGMVRFRKTPARMACHCVGLGHISRALSMEQMFTKAAFALEENVDCAADEVAGADLAEIG